MSKSDYFSPLISSKVFLDLRNIGNIRKPYFFHYLKPHFYQKNLKKREDIISDRSCTIRYDAVPEKWFSFSTCGSYTSYFLFLDVHIYIVLGCNLSCNKIAWSQADLSIIMRDNYTPSPPTKSLVPPTRFQDPNPNPDRRTLTLHLTLTLTNIVRGTRDLL